MSYNIPLLTESFAFRCTVQMYSHFVTLIWKMQHILSAVDLVCWNPHWSFYIPNTRLRSWITERIIFISCLNQFFRNSIRTWGFMPFRRFKSNFTLKMTILYSECLWNACKQNICDMNWNVRFSLAYRSGKYSKRGTHDVSLRLRCNISTLRRSGHCGIVGALWTALLTLPVTCISFVYMSSTNISNEVWVNY
jgi:hypothetical protein